MRYCSDLWEYPPLPPLEIVVVADTVPGAGADLYAEGLRMGRGTPLYSYQLSLVGGVITQPLSTQIRDINTPLLILLLLIDYTVAPPLPPVPMLSCPFLVSGEGNVRSQQFQHGDGFPSRTNSSNVVDFRLSFPPFDDRVGGSVSRAVSSFIVVVTLSSCRTKDYNSSSSSQN